MTVPGYRVRNLSNPQYCVLISSSFTAQLIREAISAIWPGAGSLCADTENHWHPRKSHYLAEKAFWWFMLYACGIRSHSAYQFPNRSSMQWIVNNPDHPSEGVIPVQPVSDDAVLFFNWHAVWGDIHGMGRIALWPNKDGSKPFMHLLLTPKQCSQSWAAFSYCLSLFTQVVSLTA